MSDKLDISEQSEEVTVNILYLSNVQSYQWLMGDNMLLTGTGIKVTCQCHTDMRTVALLWQRCKLHSGRKPTLKKENSLPQSTLSFIVIIGEAHGCLGS